jgi:hypothetical protein
MSAEKVIDIVSKECKNKCDLVVERAEYTNSLYFIISTEICSIPLRISDHKTVRNIRSYQYSGKCDTIKITKFIQRAIRSLKLKSSLVMIERINGQKIFA